MNPSEISRRDFIRQAGMAGMSIPLAGLIQEMKNSEKSPICLFSKPLQWLDYDDLAEAAKAVGFDGVDLTVRPGGHVLPENVREDLPRAVNALAKKGLTAPFMTSAITDADDIDTGPVLQTAHETGIKFYRLGYYRYQKQKPIPENLDMFGKQIRKVAGLNAKYNLHGAYQNHDGPNLVGGPIWDIWYLIKDLDTRWIGCQYDIRHATVEGGRSWPITLNLMAPYVKITAIKDFMWESREGQMHARHVPLGEGMVDFDSYFQMVREKNLYGPISLQIEYPMMSSGEEESPSRSKKIDRSMEVMKKDLDWLKAKLVKYGLRQNT